MDVNSAIIQAPLTARLTNEDGNVTLTWGTFFQGLKTVNPPLVLALVNGANNDVQAKAATEAIISGPTGAFSISGFAAGVNGRRLHLVNYSGQAMTIVNLGLSLVGNQIDTLTGGDLVFAGNASVVMVYYSVPPVSSLLIPGIWVVESTQG